MGVVEAVGRKVTRFRPGDRAVPIEHGQGTWRTHGVFEQHHWYRIPNDLPISSAATMAINPPTAIRLLEEFVQLEKGDTLIHTGGTSSTGKYVLQLAKQKGVRCVSVIRDRPDRCVFVGVFFFFWLHVPCVVLVVLLLMSLMLLLFQ